jgi:hypothetical protein
MIHPGETKQVSVYLQPQANSHATVTLQGVNLPEGLTVTPTQGKIGSTVPIQLKASRALAASCFSGVEGVFSAQVLLTVTGQSAAGTSSAQAAMDVELENPTFAPTTTDLPVMQIATDDAAPVDQQDDYITGTVAITDAANSSNNYSGSMGIKGHGNSTWSMPKKPYRLKLDSKSGLLGMKSSKNWILLANYADKSMLRTDLAFHLANVFGMFWTPSASYVEVYLNDQYEGVYQLSEKVEVDKSRLNIGEMDDTDNSGDDLTGGYIAEIDQRQDETFTMVTPLGVELGLDDPDPPTTTQSAYFASQVNLAESALTGPTFTSETTGWPAHFDRDSLVKWFLVEELMGNQDANFYSSDYFYKPRSDAKLYMGPVWDFDVSAGNVNYSPIVSPSIPWVSTTASWYVQLFKDPAFMAAVKAQWTAQRSQMDDIPSYLDTRSQTLAQGARNNYSRWPTLGVKVWPNSEAAGTYTGEVGVLKSWMTQRVAYMDAHYLQ